MSTLPAILKKISTKFKWITRIYYQIVFLFGARILRKPVISYISSPTTKWLAIDVSKLRNACLKQGLMLQYKFLDCKPQPLQELPLPLNLESIITYPLCVEFELARHELNVSKLPLDRVNYWKEYSINFANQLYEHLITVKPRAVITAQGHTVEGCILRHWAPIFKYQIFALENTMHSDRMICEPFTGISVNTNSCMAWFHRFASHAPHIDPNKFIQAMYKRKHKDHSSPPLNFNWSGTHKLVFLAQCYTDSSLIFSNNMFSTLEIVSTLINSLSPNCELVIKLHPHELNGTNILNKPINNLTYNRLKQNGIVSSKNVTIDSTNQYSTLHLIESSDIVITINSQAGLEALALGKEVILLGHSFYSNLGVTWNLNHYKLLQPTLKLILENGLKLNNTNLLAPFISIYFDHFCILKSPQALAIALKHRLTTHAIQ